MGSYPAGGMIRQQPQGSKFYVHQQAKVLAETYYDLGAQLYESLIIDIGKSDCSSEKIWKFWPVCVNISFSCEIILKLFYENEKGKLARGHKLYKDLYSKLSDDSKKYISELTINAIKLNGNKNYTLNNFENDLISCENTFAHERYVFEIIPGNSHGLQPAFLLEFAKVLNILSKVME